MEETKDHYVYTQSEGKEKTFAKDFNENVIIYNMSESDAKTMNTYLFNQKIKAKWAAVISLEPEEQDLVYKKCKIIDGD